MGYCWTSGKKVKGKWVFVKCNGNESKHYTPGHSYCYPESPKEHPRCRECAEWCKTYQEAVRIVEDWEYGMREYNKVD